MKVRYFPDTDTALIEFVDREVDETKEISENVYIDIDKDGSLVNMTIEHAKATAGLSEFAYQEMKTVSEIPSDDSAAITA